MLDGGQDAGANDIAIIGMALRVPGARDVDQFWANLRNGVESIETRTPEQLIAAGERPEKVRKRNYVPRTAELPGMADFDADFFGFSPKEAAIMDPQHRQFLECSWEALEDALRPAQAAGGQVGVFAGCGMGSYFYFNVCSNRPLVDQVGMFLLRHTGNDKDFLATRASYLLDLRGPSVNIQTACSTSLVAVHAACQSLLGGECDMALAGGVTIELPHGRGYLHQDGEILSPDGHCRAFDHRAAGTVFGSGVGVVVLRRLSDALADGDPIRAVIKATAVNNDGAGKASYLAPSVTGQAEAIVEAHGLAGIGADSIQYVECHGTGTFLGDPIEIAALTQAFRQSTDAVGFCRVGSVKTNIGHLDTAAGVVSLIKTVLALQHGEMPPTLGFEKPNPSIDFAASPFVVNDALTPWPRTSGPRRAGVNSLGVGGTNAHVVVEQAPAMAAARARIPSGPQLLVVSARSARALDDACARLASHLESQPHLDLADVASTLAHGRKHFAHRRVAAVADRADAIAVLRSGDSRRAPLQQPLDGKPGVVMMFPGGGAQHPGMGRNLYRSEPTFAKAVDEGLGYLPAAAAAEIRELWLGTRAPDEAATALLRPSLQLPAILILEVALARLWQSRGVTPAALIGHSMGENAAACIAGVMTFERAVKLVRLRGELFDEVTGGGMLSVPLSAAELGRRLPPALDLAVVNALELCVVSGPDADIEAFRAALAADGIEATRVSINVAAHSRMLEPILKRFEAFLRETRLNAPQIPIVSNLTGSWLTAAEATDPTYWVKHLRSTVRFAEGLATLAADPARVYVEVGPGRILTSLAKAQGNIPVHAVINSLPHGEEQADDRLHVLTALGRVWAAGADVPADSLWDRTARSVRLPSYPFQHQRYFIERVRPSEVDAHDAVPVKRPDIASWGWQPVWKPAYADVTPGQATVAGSYLVFLDDTGFGAALVARLSGEGHTVRTVALGDAFAVTSDGDAVLCPEHGRDGYDRLVRHLASNGGVPSHIVHAWLLTGDETFRPGSSFFHRNQERGFYSLLFLAQALGEVDDGISRQLTVLTNGMQRVGGEPLPYPEKATVLGPAQVIPRELAGIAVRIVDLDLRTTAQSGNRARVASWLRRNTASNASALVETVCEEIHATGGSEIVAHRDGKRWIRTYRERALESATASAASVRFRENGVYLITGGLGDLAMACAHDLARRYRARIVLVGRMELPERAAWSRYLDSYGPANRIGRAIAGIREIEAAGGAVHYARADVTNAESMRGVVADAMARFGAIHGVLHAAGVVKDELIALKSQSAIEDVLAPKLFGTLVLDEVLADIELDMLVLFSSTSTDTAPAGQVDYVAANAYLNAYAEARAGRRPHTVAVHWGVWSAVGLAARSVSETAGGHVQANIKVASQPLLDQRVEIDGAEQLELTIAPDRDWVLNEHRLASGEAVWPGTGYLELVAEAARELGIGGALEIEDLTFLRPLHVKDGDKKPVRIAVRQDANRLQLAIESRVETPAGAGWLRHAEATVAPHRGPTPAVLDLPAVRAAGVRSRRAESGKALHTAQDAHLRFGPRWQVLRELHIGSGEALARLRLSEQFHGDISEGLTLHPAIMDIATGFAMELIPGYDAADGLWVPMSYSRVRVLQSLPADIWSRATLRSDAALGPDFATFDIQITDAHGRVLVDITGFTIRKVRADASFAHALADVSGAKRDLAATSTATKDPAPGLQRLAAMVEHGIAPDEGFEALERALATGLPQIVVSSMNLKELQQLTAQAAPPPAQALTLARPAGAGDFVAPSTAIEVKLAGFWSELLGIEQVGVHDSFFDLGGHSLVAVRLFRMIKATYAIDFPISVLFEAPTIAQCARLIETSGVTSSGDGEADKPSAAASETRSTHLVFMHPGRRTHATPVFVCAGMFGNVLNLRHLAAHLGADRPVYGLQARGLYGDQAPHETFQDMARANLAEVRTVQPHGPYLLAGFSGGGLVALEMAQQLRAAGEQVGMLIMLDTPFPTGVSLSLADKLTMKLQDLRREKGAFLTAWIGRRLAWEMERRRKRADGETQLGSEELHNAAIEAAFRRALSRYQSAVYGGPVLMLRPPLRPAYQLKDGRLLTAGRDLLRKDNGWSATLNDLTVVEVPGDHDSMVLEPNVRVLAQHMREALQAAERVSIELPLAAE